MAIDMRKLASTDNRFELIVSDEARVVDLVNASMRKGAADILEKENFLWVDVPLMTKITGACENVDTLYSFDHFGKEAYLAQTGQLYLEGKIPLHNKLWTVITSFRAESSADSRHLNQFKLLELEHRGNLKDVMDNIEFTVKHMIIQVLKDLPIEMNLLGRFVELESWVKSPFKKLTYTKGISLLEEEGFKISWGDDLTSEHEAFLVKINGNKPLFITHFPKEIKFFNMKENESNPDVVNSCDLLMPYSGESCGAAERENDVEKLVERLKTSKMFKILSARGKTLDDFEDYIAMVRKHPILHSGCGIGINRITQSILGSNDIRTSTSYPIQCNVLY